MSYAFAAGNVVVQVSKLQNICRILTGTWITKAVTLRLKPSRDC